MLELEVDNYIATVVMNRPPVNAQNTEFRERIVGLFDSFSDRDDVRCVVLTGAGKAFSAGADLRERPALGGEPGAFWQHSRRVREGFNAVKECAKPVIAAVNGAALGSGFALMAACDIMIASEDAVFGMPEINVGLAGGAAMLNSLFGGSVGRYLFYTGNRIPASELFRLGIISACVPRDKLMETALGIAREIASKSPTAMRRAKIAYNMVVNMPERDAYRLEQNFTNELSKTEDAKEAQAAFLEKREPVFKGR